MIYYDSHIHTSFSTDSDTPMENMVRQAIQNGLRGITFTDHMDFNFPLKYRWDNSLLEMPPFLFSLPDYHATIQELKKKYKNDIDIYYGVEMGLKTDSHAENHSLCLTDWLDYTIGSIHLVDNIDPYYPEYWNSFEEKKGLARYFETTLQNLTQLGDIHIDTLGHLDYIIRYSPSGYKLYSYRMFSDVIDEILHILIERGISLEINTSGYKNGGLMPNPGEDIIRRYKELGGEMITFGSDAHTTQLLSARFDDAEKTARNAGFEYYTTFIQHKPTFHSFL